MIFEDNRDLFLEEAREFLAKMEGALVELEKRPEDGELVNEVFRALHTIKGSGAMFGFQEVSDFTHSVENLFDELRKGRLAIDSRIIDIGLRSADCIAALLGGGDGGADRALILRDIERMGQGKAGKEPEQAPGPIEGKKEQGADADLPSVYRITWKPQAQILHRGVKLESLFRELSGLGV